MTLPLSAASPEATLSIPPNVFVSPNTSMNLERCAASPFQIHELDLKHYEIHRVPLYFHNPRSSHNPCLAYTKKSIPLSTYQSGMSPALTDISELSSPQSSQNIVTVLTPAFRSQLNDDVDARLSALLPCSYSIEGSSTTDTKHCDSSSDATALSGTQHRPRRNNSCRSTQASNVKLFTPSPTPTSFSPSSFQEISDECHISGFTPSFPEEENETEIHLETPDRVVPAGHHVLPIFKRHAFTANLANASTSDNTSVTACDAERNKVSSVPTSLKLHLTPTAAESYQQEPLKELAQPPLTAKFSDTCFTAPPYVKSPMGEPQEWTGDHVNTVFQVPNAYCPNPLSIFIGNIPKNVTRYALYRLLRAKGDVTEVQCNFRPNCWLTAFVTYSKAADAARAVESFHNRRLLRNAHPHRMVCCFAPPPPQSLCVLFGTPQGNGSRFSGGPFHLRLISSTSPDSCVPPADLLTPFFPKFEDVENVAVAEESVPSSKDGTAQITPLPQRFSLLRDGPPGANLFVYGIPSDWTEVTLMRLFQQFGCIVGIRVPEVPTSEPRSQIQNKTFAFVSYASTESSMRASQCLSGLQILGKTLNIQLKNGDQHICTGGVARGIFHQQQPLHSTGILNSECPHEDYKHLRKLQRNYPTSEDDNDRHGHDHTQHEKLERPSHSDRYNDYRCSEKKNLKGVTRHSLPFPNRADNGGFPSRPFWRPSPQKNFQETPPFNHKEYSTIFQCVTPSVEATNTNARTKLWLPPPWSTKQFPTDSIGDLPITTSAPIDVYSWNSATPIFSSPLTAKRSLKTSFHLPAINSINDNAIKLPQLSPQALETPWALPKHQNHEQKSNSLLSPTRFFTESSLSCPPSSASSPTHRPVDAPSSRSLSRQKGGLSEADQSFFAHGRRKVFTASPSLSTSLKAPEKTSCSTAPTPGLVSGSVTPLQMDSDTTVLAHGMNHLDEEKEVNKTCQLFSTSSKPHKESSTLSRSNVPYNLSVPYSQRTATNRFSTTTSCSSTSTFVAPRLNSPWNIIRRASAPTGPCHSSVWPQSHAETNDKLLAQNASPPFHPLFGVPQSPKDSERIPAFQDRNSANSYRPSLSHINGVRRLSLPSFFTPSSSATGNQGRGVVQGRCGSSATSSWGSSIEPRRYTYHRLPTYPSFTRVSAPWSSHSEVDSSAAQPKSPSCATVPASAATETIGGILQGIPKNWRENRRTIFDIPHGDGKDHASQTNDVLTAELAHQASSSFFPLKSQPPHPYRNSGSLGSQTTAAFSRSSATLDDGHPIVSFSLDELDDVQSASLKPVNTGEGQRCPQRDHNSSCNLVGKSDVEENSGRVLVSETTFPTTIHHRFSLLEKPETTCQGLEPHTASAAALSEGIDNPILSSSSSKPNGLELWATRSKDAEKNTLPGSSDGWQGTPRLQRPRQSSPLLPPATYPNLSKDDYLPLESRTSLPRYSCKNNDLPTCAAAPSTAPRPSALPSLTSLRCLSSSYGGDGVTGSLFSSPIEDHLCV